VEYLVLDDGPPWFTPDFSCPILLGSIYKKTELHIYRTITRYGPTSQTVLCMHSFVTFSNVTRHSWYIPQPRYKQRLAPWHLYGLDYVPVRSSLLRESLTIYFPLVTEIFHFTRFPHLCTIKVRVAPFRDLQLYRLLAPYYKFSQPITSFIGSTTRGIHSLLLNKFTSFQKSNSIMLRTHSDWLGWVIQKLRRVSRDFLGKFDIVWQDSYIVWF
jgi:hypothetical protein